MKYVISLGGSVINPGEIDKRFLEDFTKLIKSRLRQGDEFLIITGGGALARERIEQAQTEGMEDEEKLDWIGIKATEENAKVLKDFFNENDPVEIYGGEKPGQSTDTVAVKVAHKNGVKTVINLSNVDYVYTNDPNKDKKAKKIESIDHKGLLDLIGRERKPGGHYPFDPVAIQLAEKEKIKIIVMNGSDLLNFENLLTGKEFQGTVIE